MNATRHSFIIRIWIEETEEGSSRVTWRGTITHALSQECAPVLRLPQILRFLCPYLKSMGARLSWLDRIYLHLGK